MSCGVPDFCQAEVLVVGDIMLDRYWNGQAHRLSPEAPVPVVKVSEIEERPGGAANVAMNITALGGRATLLGLTGYDEASESLLKKLQDCQVQCDFEQSKQHPTITKLRILSRNQQLLRLDFEMPFQNEAQHGLLQRVARHLPNKKVVVFSDYAKGALAKIREMITLAKEQQLPILVDPKGNDFERYRGAFLLTPNLNEFEAVVGVCQSESELVTRGMELLHRFELNALLITRSEQGMTLLQRDREPFHLATHAQEVFDVTGAGDTVIATLASCLAAGVALEEACYFANVAAGVVIAKLGTSVLSLIELENAIRGRAAIGFGILAKDELKVAMQIARQRGERIVMTNGCFDILHAGHVSYLGNARQLGDRLIVAVNSDASTRRLKGELRPINTLQQRMIVLSALESVDWVIPFDEDTPQQLIAELLPDVLVKGGDYQVTAIAGAVEVKAAGGEVKVLNFEEGCSTSNIINKIKHRES